MPVMQLVLTAALLFGPAQARAETPLPFLADTLVGVGGRRLHFEVHEGTLPVTIVLEAGGDADLTSWGSVPDSLARTGATIVAYDRASIGSSDPGPADLTPEQEMRDLRGALASLGVPARTILIGTSYGAMLALLHAGLYPEDVAGLVLVDPMNHVFIEETGDFVQSTVPDVPEPTTEIDRLIVRMKRTLEELTDRTGAIEPELTVPIVVITAGKAWWGQGEIDRAWRASHETMAGRRPGRELVVAEDSSHHVAAQRPDVIVAAVARVLAAVTKGE